MSKDFWFELLTLFGLLPTVICGAYTVAIIHNDMPHYDFHYWIYSGLLVGVILLSIAIFIKIRDWVRDRNEYERYLSRRAKPYDLHY